MKASHLTVMLSAFAIACGTDQTSSQDNTSDKTSDVPTNSGAGSNGNDTHSSRASDTSPATSTPSAADTATTQHTDDNDTNSPDETHARSDAGDSASSPVNETSDVSDAVDDTNDNSTSSNESASTQTDDSTTQPTAMGEPVEEELTPVPTARGEHGVGALKGEVYVLGGFTPTVTSSVQAYSPETNQWRDVADFPVVFHHPNVATVNDLLYVLGFHAGSGQRQGDGSAYVYDPEADAWTALTPMPPGTERGASCVTTYQDKVYVFGGTNGAALPDASTYDPATDEWETLPFVPATRHHCIAAELNGKIYIVSGRDVVIEEVQAESYIFDPIAKTFTEVAPILTPRGGAAGGLLGGRIYVFGGEGNRDDPRGIFHEAEVYDPLSDTWQALPDMNVPRHGLDGAVIGDRIYLPAGSLSQGIDVTDTFSAFYLQ